MRKLNFGCGSKFVAGWDNIDFYSDGPNVLRVNLLNDFPYATSTFDYVYSSHVIEHFTRDQGVSLLAECFRVLKPGGVVRVVVPDLAMSVDEYQRVRQMPNDDPAKECMYRWITIELLDQLVRMKKHGSMGEVLSQITRDPWSSVADYIVERAGDVCAAPSSAGRPDLLSRLRRLTWQTVASRGVYVWLNSVKQLVPRSLRPLVFVNTSVGERHQWMYDEYGMMLLLRDAGFVNTHKWQYNSTGVDRFDWDSLDLAPEGHPYKKLSLYMEGQKPS